MFSDKYIYGNKKNNKFSGFPNLVVPDKNPIFFEPQFRQIDNNKNLFQPKPDWTPDFSERIDVVEDSINLALHTLGMSKSEYNASDTLSLKSQRRIDCSSKQIWALNILIYYKKNTITNLPCSKNYIKHMSENINKIDNEFDF